MRRLLGTVPLPDLASAIACCLLPQPDAPSAKTIATTIAQALIIISPKEKLSRGQVLTDNESESDMRPSRLASGLNLLIGRTFKEGIYLHLFAREQWGDSWICSLIRNLLPDLGS
jgi:hypothetical protein